MQKTFSLLWAIIGLFAVTAHGAPIYRSHKADLARAPAPTIDAYEANVCAIEWTLKNGGDAVDLTDATPFMWWAESSDATGTITASCSVVTATAGVFRAVFSGAQMNVAADQMVYGVGVDQDGTQTFRSGVLNLQADPYATGSNLPPMYSTNVNWDLIDWLNLPAYALETWVIDYVSTNGASGTTDSIARAGVASNAVDIAALPPSQGVTVWKDAETNYFAKMFDGTVLTNDSFSDLLNIIIVDTNRGVNVEVGPSQLGDQYGAFYIDSPIEVAGFTGFTLRGRGNYGTTISPAEDYTGEMFVLTNMSGICRFEDIRFQAGESHTSLNTNAVINATDCNELVVKSCEFDYFLGPAIRHGEGNDGVSAWNRIQDCWMVGGRNIHPMIELESGDSGGASWDMLIQGCYFYNWTTSASIRISGQYARDVQIVGNKFGSLVGTEVNGIEIVGGYGAHITGNKFKATTGKTIAFNPASSNNFHAIVSGNSWGYSSTTNAIWMNADTYGVMVGPNEYGRGDITVSEPTNQTPVRIDWFKLGTNSPVEDWPAETDPVFSSSEAFEITANDKDNWNDAVSWGDHSTAGYQTAPEVGTIATSVVAAADYTTPAEAQALVDTAQLADGVPYAIPSDGGVFTLWTSNRWDQAATSFDAVSTMRVSRVGASTNAGIARLALYFGANTVTFETNNILGLDVADLSADTVTNIIALEWEADGSTNVYGTVKR